MILGRKGFQLHIKGSMVKNMVSIRIIFNENDIIGTFSDSTYLPTFIGSLYYLLDKPIDVDELSSESFYLKEFNRFKNQTSSIQHSVLMLGDSFDDYYIYTIKSKDKLAFVWSHVESPFFSYESYSVKPSFYECSLDIIIDSVKQLEKQLL